MSRSTLLSILRAVISFGLIALILWRADLGATVETMKGLQWLPFFAALLTNVAAVSLRSYKWHLLLGIQGGRGPLWTSLRLTFMSTFINNFFIGTLGGDAYRAYHAKDYSRSSGGAASAVVMERVTGLLSALLLVFVTGTFLSYGFVTRELLLVVSLVGVAGVGALIVLARLGARASRIPGLGKLGRLTDLIEEMSTSLMAYRNHRGVLAFAVALSIVFHALQAVTLLLFAVAVGLSVPFLAILFISPLTGILVVLPISMNGIGVKEGSLVFFLERIGAAGPQALLVALLSRLGNITISLIGGIFFVMERSARRNAALEPPPAELSGNRPPGENHGPREAPGA
jgi:uncharacterized protein (TIRG00374 family)